MLIGGYQTETLKPLSGHSPSLKPGSVKIIEKNWRWDQICMATWNFHELMIVWIFEKITSHLEFQGFFTKAITNNMALAENVILIKTRKMSATSVVPSISWLYF